MPETGIIDDEIETKRAGICFKRFDQIMAKIVNIQSGKWVIDKCKMFVVLNQRFFTPDPFFLNRKRASGLGVGMKSLGPERKV